MKMCPHETKGKRERCNNCQKMYEHGHKRFMAKPHKQFKKTRCERCGFLPEHVSQLDVDHKNGNHFDDSPENLQTLCANCHRLKTATSGDYMQKRFRNG